MNHMLIGRLVLLILGSVLCGWFVHAETKDLNKVTDTFKQYFYRTIIFLWCLRVFMFLTIDCLGLFPLE